MIKARVFVGYGYNDRDRWIEEQVFPILEALDFQVLHGRDMHGDVLQDGVKQRIHDADGVIGFCTLRQENARDQFNTHVWVRDEMVHALAIGRPVIEVRETSVNQLPGLVGDRQRINYDPARPLDAVRELVCAVKRWSVARLQIIADDLDLLNRIARATRDPSFSVTYRARVEGVDMAEHQSKVERIQQGLYLLAREVPRDALIEVRGQLNGSELFSSGWEPVNAVQIHVLGGGNS